MKSRVFASILLIPLLVSCTSDGPELARIPSPSATTTPDLGLELEDDCRFDRRTQGDVSFVKDGKLYLMNVGDDSAHCAFEVGDASDVEWGPAADRVHVGDLRRFGTNGRMAGLPQAAESISWSRPTGTSLVYISEGRLMKTSAFGRKSLDISFLADHDEVVYHPSGTHVAVAGTDDDGTYGLWLATNLGEEQQLIAIGEDAKRMYSLAFSYRGPELFYAAEHEDHYDVHSLELARQDDEGRSRTTRGLETHFTSEQEISNVVVTQFDFLDYAYTVGSCTTGLTAFQGGRPIDLPGSASSVGWLSTGELLLLVRDTGCEGPGDLYVADTSRLKSRLIAEDVDAAGVRLVLPTNALPPGSEQEVIA